MLEVRPSLLLGGMGDALAVFTRVPSLVARYHVTHVLSLCNDPPEWIDHQLATPDQDGSGGSDSELKDVDEKEEISNEKSTEEKAEEEEEKDGGEATRSGRGRQRGRRKRGKGQVELPKWRKFIEVADMPKSDLLHHFEECCHFIRDGRERGTVLVHCEHGVSRSVTVVLAYLMWSERRSLRILYQELKERKPEIRPNSGFMDQLRLWEDMGCHVKDDNKKYRAYRLQCKAREIEATGRVAVVEMAPDPAVSPVDAALYFRCRKCRQLLFTDGDVLQHTLGEGRESFSRRHRGKKDWSKYHGEGVLVKAGQLEAKEKEREPQTAVDQLPEMKKEAVIEEAEEKQRAMVELKETVELQLATEIGSQEEIEFAQKAPRELGWSDGGTCERTKREEEDGLSEEVVLGGNPDCPAAGIPWDHTPSLLPTETEASAMRREVGTLLAQRAVHSSLSPSCTSYFIEPVAWMGDALLGHLEGKILCPKCNCRLGSFSWKGQQCSCGRWPTPAFQVHKNRVDEVRTLSKRKFSSTRS